MKLNQSISVFFPAYNDEHTIAKMVMDSLETLKRVTDNYEVIVVDDGGPDRSGEIADELAAAYPKVKVVHHKKNRGYGGALRSGFRAASKDWIFYTDGDAQYDPKELVKLLEKVTPDVDVVNGFKLKRQDPWYRILIGRVYHHTVKTFFNLKIRDVDCDFRLIKRTVFDKVKLTQNSGVICVELMKKIHMHNFKIREVGVHHYPREHGVSQFFNFRRVGRVGIALANLWIDLVLLRRK